MPRASSPASLSVVVERPIAGDLDEPHRAARGIGRRELAEQTFAAGRGLGGDALEDRPLAELVGARRARVDEQLPDHGERPQVVGQRSVVERGADEHRPFDRQELVEDQPERDRRTHRDADDGERVRRAERLARGIHHLIAHRARELGGQPLDLEVGRGADLEESAVGTHIGRDDELVVAARGAHRRTEQVDRLSAVGTETVQ